jgi:hypothetical protein
LPNLQFYFLYTTLYVVKNDLLNNKLQDDLSPVADVILGV